MWLVFVAIQFTLASLLHQILNRTPKHLRKLADGVNACLVDVLLPLFIHLNRAQADAGELRKLVL